MGITYTTIEIRNPVRPDLSPVAVTALADTGALHLCIPRHIALQLMLDAQEEREVTLADGSILLVPYVGPLGLRFGNRQCFVGALVMGDEVLLGAIPMEDMDLVVMPMTRQVAINPASPNIPSSVAKGIRTGGRRSTP
jgi:clan AA aspartic protease